MTLVANAQGRISGQFTVPAAQPSGVKRVAAEGRGGTRATALYAGGGTIETSTLQRVFSTRFWRDLPPPVVAPDTNWGFGSGDPLAQTLQLDRARHITGIDVKFKAFGDQANAVICQLREVQLGVPGPRVLGEAFLSLADVVLGAWTTLRFRSPVFIEAGVEVAAVFMTDDGLHAIAIATGGEFDAAKQQLVTGQPYAIGVLLSGSNTSTWTPHQKSDLTFRLRAARFSAVSRVVEAGTFDLAACTDLVVFAGVQIPAADTGVAARITRASGEVLTVRPGQPLRFDEPVTEAIAVAFVLTGTAEHSPVLFPFVQVFAGTQAGSGSYITRAMPASSGAPMRVTITADVFAPGASTVTAEVGPSPSAPGGAITWAAAPLTDGVPVGDGWIERTWIVDGYGAADVRARLLLAGTARDRPLVRDLRVVVTDTPVNVTD